MRGVQRQIGFRRAFSADERSSTSSSSSSKRHQSFSVGDRPQLHRRRSEKMSLYGGTSSSSSGSTSNLYRSQSMASLTSDRMVLGDSFRSSYMLRAHRTAVLKELGLNTKSLSRVPKHPRPKRTVEIFSAVTKGLRDNIKATDQDYNQVDEDHRLRSSAAHNQKLKTIERHKKKLEYLLSKIEELQDHYQVQNQMREGTKALSKAYERSVGQKKKDSMLSVHYGFKECSKTMCAIEAQLESMLGQFHCEMKGIMGFARVMPGDSFEVSIRHGNQKWKTKGYVSKDSEQQWDISRRCLNVQLNSSLTVKVFESKRLSRSSLGEKHCDIIGLFASNPQILTVNVNDIGTIKLNILVQWMPLANFTDQMKYFDPPPRDAISPRPLSLLVSSPTETSNLSNLVQPAKSPPQTNGSTSPMSRPDLLCDMKDDCKGNVRTLADAIEEEEGELDSFEWPENLEQAVQRLRDALVDYQEHSSTLKSLHDLVNELDSILTVETSSASMDCPKNTEIKRDISQPVMNSKLSMEHRRQSSISLAIESAFDFLNGEDCESDSDDTGELPSAISPTSTARSIADSGIESLLTSQNTMASCNTAAMYSSGNKELDLVIVQHCVLTELLTENLDNVGMLKSKERFALNSLKQQKKIFSGLVTLVRSLSDSLDGHVNIKQILMETAPRHPDLHEFWIGNSELGSMRMSVVEFSTALYQAYHSVLQHQYNISTDKVFNEVLKRVTLANRFHQPHQKELFITLHQLMHTILDSKCKTLESYVHQTASEIWLINQLKSGDSLVVVRAIKSLHGATPPLDVLKVLLMLVSSSVPEISHEIADLWSRAAQDKSAKDNLLPSVLSCLEDTRSDIRVGACICLSRIKATSAVDELMYIAQADSSRRVQAAARNSLATLNTVIGSASLRR